MVLAKLRVLISRLLGATRHGRLDQEFDDEAEAHLDMLTERFAAQGMSPEEARFSARRQFGGLTQMKEDLREARAWPALESMIRDFRQTVRRLARTPVFTLATVLTIALGIGANTAIFSVINCVLLKPLPFPEPDRLAGVWQTAPGVNIKDVKASIADYITYREEAKTFADVAVWEQQAAIVTEFAEAERVEGISVSFRFFPLLGVQPSLGRGFTDKDHSVGSPEAVILSHGYWMRRFGGDPKVLGRRIITDGTAREIVGVLPEGFWFMDLKHDLVHPLRFDRAKVRLGGYNYNAVARLRPGATMGQANADVARMIGIAFRKFPPPQGMSTKMMEDARLGPNVRSLVDDLTGDIGKSLWVVMATIGIVLLIACANVTNLLLARTEGRAQELAVRAAIGASRGRIAWELMAESLTLALTGGLVGTLFAAGLLKLVLRLTPVQLPRLEHIAIDSTALSFTFAVSIASGLAFGALPVLKHGGILLSESLRAGSRNSSASRDRNIARNSLTAVQVALALVLLIGSALMIRTFQSMRRVDPGFSDAGTLQTLRISIPGRSASAEPELRAIHQNLVDRLSTIPGVERVSLINGLPMSGISSQNPIAARDHSYAANQLPPLRLFASVAPNTFSVMGTALRAGRELTWTDLLERRSVVLISENFAREYWGSAAAALGKQIRSVPTDPWSEIVGVVADIRHDGVQHKAPSVVYWPIGRRAGSLTCLIRSSRAGTESFTADIRRAVSAMGAGVMIADMQTMGAVYERSLSRTAFTMALLGISGCMALLVALVGIYAVVSYAVSQRTREIGIRLALGAQQGELKMMFVRSGLLWGGIGAAAGLTAAAGLSQLVSTLLFEISPVDPLSYFVVAVALLAAVAAASYLPARQAARVDPLESLRAD